MRDKVFALCNELAVAPPAAAEAQISPAEMFSFFEMTPDLVCIAGKDGYFRKVNPAVLEKLGYSEPELFARPIASFIHPEDRVLTHQTRTEMLNGQPLVNFQNRYLAKSGKIVWLEWTSIYSSGKEMVFAIAKDITARKQAENKTNEDYQKFKILAAHFKNSIEKDRKCLATDLHEELAQLASVVKMDLGFISEHEGELPAPLKQRLEHALAVSDLLMKTIRRMSFAISPTMLEDLGLNETLRWHCAEFSLLNGIPCFFESNYNSTPLTPEIKLDLFRICQEALRNVMHHAKARKVVISIEGGGNEICLSVTDDGRGFDMKQQKQGAGLQSILVRTASINGRLQIRTRPGKGTRLEVRVAMNEELN